MRRRVFSFRDPTNSIHLRALPKIRASRHFTRPWRSSISAADGAAVTFAIEWSRAVVMHCLTCAIAKSAVAASSPIHGCPQSRVTRCDGTWLVG